MSGLVSNRGHLLIRVLALFEHFCIFCDILMSATTDSISVSVRKWCIKENTSVIFM